MARPRRRGRKRPTQPKSKGRKETFSVKTPWHGVVRQPGSITQRIKGTRRVVLDQKGPTEIHIPRSGGKARLTIGQGKKKK